MAFSILTRWWRNISIARKLFLVVGVMAVLIVCELMTLTFAMDTLSAARAFVGGESLWSKSQKDAALSLQRYALSKNEADYQDFLKQFRIPEAYHDARAALLREKPDFNAAKEAFIRGSIHPADVDSMLVLLSRFRNFDFMARAIAAWEKGDELNGKIKSEGKNVRIAVLSQNQDLQHEALRRVANLSKELTSYESEFSYQLGIGSRLLESFVLKVLVSFVLLVEGIGLTLTFLLSRSIARRLKELGRRAQEIGRKKFDFSNIDSLDEIGQLSLAMAQADHRLNVSYNRLEEMVQDRAREVADSKGQLNVVLEGILDGVTMTDESGRFIYVNDVVAHMCGYTDAKELTAENPTLYDLFDRMEVLDEDGHPFPVENIPSRQLFRGVPNPPEVLVLFGRRGSDVKSWTLLKSASVYDERRKVGFAVSILRDFNEHKRAEETLEYLNNASTILASTVDLEETLENTLNIIVPLLADMCAIDIFDEEGKILQSKTRSHTRSEQARLFEKVRNEYPLNWRSKALRRNLNTTSNGVLHSKLTDKTLRQVAVDENHYQYLKALKIESAMRIGIVAHGRLFGVISLMTSESKRNYTDRDLLLAQELARKVGMAIDNALLFQKAKKAVDVRDEFLSIASHELKTPLTSLNLQIQNARYHQNLPPEKLAKTLDKSETQIKRLTGLVEDLLDASRIQTGKFSFSFERSSLSDLATEMVSRYQVQMTEAGCKFRTSIEPNVILNLDKVRVEQVIDNLLSNAIKYAPGSLVHLSVSKTPKGARLIIYDKGPGIPLEKQPFVFERFERVASTTHHVSGLGLGLFIVRKIVEGHGGKVTLESQEGQGSSFIIELPDRPVLVSSGLSVGQDV